MTGVRDERGGSRFRCVDAYLERPLAKPQLVEATCEGRVLTAPRGSGGFGDDPLFFSTDLEMTFAEASLPPKQRGSHRGRAIPALTEVLLRRSRELFPRPALAWGGTSGGTPAMSDAAP